MASPESVAQPVNVDLLKSFFQKEEHRRHLSRLLRDLELEDKELQSELSAMFVRRAIIEGGFSDDSLETTADLKTQALILAGLNTRGRSLVSPSLQRQAFESLLPQALKNDGDGLLNKDVGQALIGYINHDKKTPFFSEGADRLLGEMLDDKTQKALLQRVADQALTSPLPPAETQAMLAKHNVKPSSRVEAANDPAVPQSPGMAVGSASDEFKYPDAGEFSDNAYREAEKYRLAVDRRAEARDKINAILKEKQGWVERTVVDRLRAKKKQFVEDFNDGALFVKDPLKYPKESIFSETLSEVDETGREVHELVVMKNTPLSTKAVFKTPDAPKEAYEISALRLVEQGVKRPYINATFKDKGKCQQFLMQSVEGLLKAGYDIDDIVVAPRIKHLFAPIYEHHMQRGMLSEAPEDLVASPDDPAVARRHGQEEPEPGPARPSGNEEVHSKIRALHEPLDAVINMYDGAEEGQSQQIRDLDPAVLAEAMSLAPFVEDEVAWQRAVDEGGLNPRSNEFMKKLVGDFKQMVADAATKEPSQLGAKTAALILANDKNMPIVFEGDPEGINQARDAYRNATKRVAGSEPERGANLSEPSNNDMPPVGHDELPLPTGDDMPPVGHDAPPLPTGDDMPPVGQDAPPLPTGDDMPPVGQDAPPLPTGDDMPPMDHDEPPLPTGDDMPPMGHDEPPLPTGDDMPPVGQDAPPLPTGDDMPPMGHDEPPLPTGDDMPPVGQDAPPLPTGDDMPPVGHDEPPVGGGVPANDFDHVNLLLDSASEKADSGYYYDDVDIGQSDVTPPNPQAVEQPTVTHGENVTNVPASPSADLEAFSEPEGIMDVPGEVVPSEKGPGDEHKAVKSFDLVTDMDKKLIERLANLPDDGFTSEDAELLLHAQTIVRYSAHEEQLALYIEDCFDGDQFVDTKRKLRDCLVAYDSVLMNIEPYKNNAVMTSAWKLSDPSTYPSDCKDAIIDHVGSPGLKPGVEPSPPQQESSPPTPRRR